MDTSREGLFNALVASCKPETADQVRLLRQLADAEWEWHRVARRRTLAHDFALDGTIEGQERAWAIARTYDPALRVITDRIGRLEELRAGVAVNPNLTVVPNDSEE